MAKPGVVAVGKGFKVSGGKTTDTLCYICSVEKKLPAAMLKTKDMVPPQVEGIKTDVVETGKIKALADPTKRYRPAMPGISVGHYQITAGTLGLWVKKADDPSGEYYLLSNNHVLANVNKATVGDAILQPGAFDGGSLSTDTIAHLTEFVPIVFSQIPSECNIARLIVSLLNKLSGKHRTKLSAYAETDYENYVDCALAKPVSQTDVDLSINGIGNHTGAIISSALGMQVQKSGRTTGVTKSEVLQVDVTVAVDMGDGNVALFADQIVTGGEMSSGGDSGSAILDMDKNITGLLFAGSDSATVYNPIERVVEALKIKFA